MSSELFRRLQPFLQLDPRNASHQRVIMAHEKDRTALLDRFPLLAMALVFFEKESEDGLIQMVEAILWDTAWIDRFKNDSGSLDPCRKKLATFLEMIVGTERTWIRDPNFVTWVVVASLEVERTSQRKGLSKMFGSKQADMIDAIARDCTGRMASKRPLPDDLRDRLKNLERSGVFINSDIFAAIQNTSAEK